MDKLAFLKTSEDKWTFISLIIMALCFLVYKIAFLHIPYFWDESWVYGPAVSEMGQRIPSLIPGSISIDLSRGHPMLFHFLGGVWGNIFGISITSLHSFALLISLTLLAILYKIIKNETNTPIAAISIILLMTQGLFLAQSAMVLPEVLVAVFGTLSLYYYSRDKFIFSAVFAAACLLTKESGIVLMPAIVITYFIDNILRGSFRISSAIRIIFYFILACVPYIVFLALQKYKFDWYLYPNHMDLQIDSVEAFQGQLKAGIGSLLVTQNRVFLTGTALLALIIKYYKKRFFIFSLIWTIINLLIIYLIDIKSWKILLLYGIISTTSLMIILWINRKDYKKEHRLIFTITIFSGLYLTFTAFNFFSTRYIFILLPLYVYLSTRSIYEVTEKSWKYIVYAILAIIILPKGLSRSPLSDTTQGFINAGQAQKELFLYLEQNVKSDEIIIAPFLVREALIKRYAGYRTNDNEFTNLPWTPAADKSFYSIVTAIEGEYTNGASKEGREILFEKEFKKDNAWYKIVKYSKVK